MIRARLRRIDPLPVLFWLFVLAGIPAVTVWMALEPDPQVTAVVPARDLAPFHVVRAGDLELARVDRDGASDALRAQDAVAGRYPLVPLARGHPIREGDLAPRRAPRYLERTLAIAIPSSSATTLGGTLRQGDVVTLTQFPAAAGARPHVYCDVLVLAPRSASVLVALPERRWREFASADRGATYRVTRRVAG